MVIRIYAQHNLFRSLHPVVTTLCTVSFVAVRPTQSHRVLCSGEPLIWSMLCYHLLEFLLVLSLNLCLVSGVECNHGVYARADEMHTQCMSAVLCCSLHK